MLQPSLNRFVFELHPKVKVNPSGQPIVFFLVGKWDKFQISKPDDISSRHCTRGDADMKYPHQQTSGQ